MKKIIYLNLFLFTILSTISCSKESMAKDGKIVFWISRTTGNCGVVNVSITNGPSGNITHWQAIAPTTCNSSNTLLVLTTKQGTKTVKFKTNCGESETTINLDSECFIYNVF